MFSILGVIVLGFAFCVLLVTFVWVARILAMRAREKSALESEAEGSSLFSVDDIIDWPALCSQLNRVRDTDQPSPERRIWSLLSHEIQSDIEAASRGNGLKEEQKYNIVNALNEILSRRDFYQKQDLPNIPIPKEAKKLLELRRKELSPKEIQRLNRLLVEAAYPREITKSQVGEIGRSRTEEITRSRTKGIEKSRTGEIEKEEMEEELPLGPGVIGKVYGANYGLLLGILACGLFWVSPLMLALSLVGIFYSGRALWQGLRYFRMVIYRALIGLGLCLVSMGLHFLKAIGEMPKVPF